jgi:hypothetical protein
MNVRLEILEFIERLSGLLPGYIIARLKEETVLNLVSLVIDRSGKVPGDALILFVTAVKYLWGGVNAFAEIEKKDSFHEFVEANRDTIIELAARKRMQANVPTRAFPLIEVINRKIEALPVAVIELGASRGLLGWTLLEPDKIIKMGGSYFSPAQKLPVNPRPIDYYLGIELEINEKEWLLSCTLNPTTESYLRNFVDEIPHESEKFNLLQGSALGFSNLEPVKQLVSRPFTLVVLTSFIFFQIGIENERKIKKEIRKFIGNRGGGQDSHWLNQVVKPPEASTDIRFYIEWNGETIIESSDSICSGWKWLAPGS